ncbi:hypothetical protein [Chryseobacterium sp. ERMR1:04]|uniref:hypothetical protein n=1 Tax=Chryseobacterium sp. ERMR1:04 TaxID=1705393 RepID=UPI0006C8E486|nr:hypothetical protein [Chryseobacterium sp. ERMR1:04]KPH14767.1 hypothetical protein AMQ68_04790 [Chryseobacterium sp. ERMR1:04]
MKKIFITVILCIGSILFGQVGMNTPNPRGALDINKNTTHNMGLILPTNSDTNNIINPMGGKVIPGTIIYDSAKDCIRFYKKTDQWSNCIQFSKTAINAKNIKTSNN